MNISESPKKTGSFGRGRQRGRGGPREISILIPSHHYPLPRIILTCCPFRHQRPKSKKKREKPATCPGKERISLSPICVRAVEEREKKCVSLPPRVHFEQYSEVKNSICFFSKKGVTDIYVYSCAQACARVRNKGSCGRSI